MKQRITYLVPNPDDFNPDLLFVKESSLSLRNVKAAKEHRITFGLSELPLKLRKAFEQWHELHIRWASDTPYEAVPPFTSRVSPGLHVFFTPQKDHPKAPLCPLLKDFFGHDLKCTDTKDSFTKLPITSERFSMSASSQYYSYVPDLSNFVSLLKKLCPPSSMACKDAATSLLSASYLDIDYDAISHAVKFDALWAEAPTAGGAWTESISLPGTQETIEVGVLSNEPNPDPEDIAFSGFLTVLGQDTKPKPTRFQTPTRHYPLPQSPSTQQPLTYKSTFPHPTGLHPTLLLTLPSASLTPPSKSCKLHTHLTLPSTLFIDKYAFTDPLFLSSHNLKSLRSISGATDLEAPDWVVPQWGSAALFELATPQPQSQSQFPSSEEKSGEVQGEHWNISIPLHLRYLPASNTTSHTPLAIPWPTLFWACRAEEGAKMAANPFDRVHLGYEALFGPKTRFMHIPPASEGNGSAKAVSWIEVPVLDLRQTVWVEGGTVGVVVAAFLGLCWVLFGRSGGRKEKEARKEARKEKKKQ